MKNYGNRYLSFFHSLTQQKIAFSFFLFRCGVQSTCHWPPFFVMSNWMDFPGDTFQLIKPYIINYPWRLRIDLNTSSRPNLSMKLLKIYLLNTHCAPVLRWTAMGNSMAYRISVDRILFHIESTVSHGIASPKYRILSQFHFFNSVRQVDLGCVHFSVSCRLL